MAKVGESYTQLPKTSSVKIEFSFGGIEVSGSTLRGRLGEGGFPKPSYLTWKDRKERGRREFFFDNSLKMEYTGFSIWDQTEYLSASTTEDRRLSSV